MQEQSLFQVENHAEDLATIMQLSQKLPVPNYLVKVF